MTPRLPTDYAKNYCNRTLIVTVIVENIVTFFIRHSVVTESRKILGTVSLSISQKQYKITAVLLLMNFMQFRRLGS